MAYRHPEALGRGTNAKIFAQTLIYNISKWNERAILIILIKIKYIMYKVGVMMMGRD